MMEVIHREHAFSDMFVSDFADTEHPIRRGLGDQLFNSSEKRSARIFVLSAHFGKDGRPEVCDSNRSRTAT